MIRRVSGALLLGLSLAACRNESVAPGPLGKDYYPLAVGTEHVYDVEDRVYTQNTPVVTTSQVREQLTEAYRDAAGALTYKLVRSTRATAADGWRVDSAFTLTVNPQNLLLTRSNLRTVELIFPVREGAEWNRNAFNNRDTLIAVNRRYQDVGSSFAAGARSYDNTVTTYAFTGTEGDIYHVNEQRVVYAKGIGPVLRESRRLDYCEPDRGCVVGTIVSGRVHRETLVQ
jgi:hypothetical protein